MAKLAAMERIAIGVDLAAGRGVAALAALNLRASLPLALLGGLTFRAIPPRAASSSQHP